MSEECRRILDLLAEGKISADEAERLLQPLAAASEAPREEGDGARRKPSALLVSVRKRRPTSAGAADPSDRGSDAGEVTVRLPMAIVRRGLRLGALLPGLDLTRARLRERGIVFDLSRIDPATLESMLDELQEINIDLESGRARVRITCE